MADKAADDHMERLSQLAAGRSSFEQVWRQVARVAAPDAVDFAGSGTLGATGIRHNQHQPLAAHRSKQIYDVTAINAVDRLASGIEALVAPQAEYWHGLEVTNWARRVGSKATDEEKAWLEAQRNLMFTLRYDADSGFVPAFQTAIRRTIAFGNAFVWLDESFDEFSMFRYQHIPLAECYIATDAQDIMTTWYRYYSLTAEQAKGFFKEKLSPQIARAAESPVDKDKQFRFARCIHPSADYNEGSSPFAYKSVHVDCENRSIVGTRGFFEMPVIDFRWLPEKGPYGEGPVMRVLSEIQSANQLAKNELIASEQSVRPALLVANAGVMNRPNTNPGAINFGGMNPNGQELIKPLNIGGRLDFATMVLEAKKNAIKESLYINLFQLLVQNPQMSATEALIRANEKAELLGPAGSRLQGGLSRMIRRELGILARRGLYDADSVYAKPRSVGAGRVTVDFTSPLDRLRRAKEGEGISRLLEMVAPIAQVDPSIVDNFDGDETVRQLRDILGAPVSILRRPEDVQRIRQGRQEQQAATQNAAIAEQLAAASAQGTKALAGAKEAGAL